MLETVGIDEVKRDKLAHQASKIFRLTSVTCRDLQILLGHMAACIMAVPLVQLKSRHLHRDLNRVYVSMANSKRWVHLSP